MRVTIKVKISEQPQFVELYDKFLKACQYATDKAFEHKIKHKFALHKLIYYDMRKKFQLKSQFCINAIARGFEAFKSCEDKVVFKSVPLRYDRRTFTFKPNSIRLTINDGRIDVPIHIADYYIKYLAWTYQTADLVRDRQNRYFLHITFSKDIIINKVTRNNVVGVDVGVNNLAVTSDGKVFSGYKTKIMQYQYLRRKLQRKGTKSAKRLLKKVSGRQKRFMRHINHNISKNIVADADIIVLEDLKGIRKSRNKYKGKRLNRWLNSWSFFQLQEFITYKAEMQGKVVKKVNPYMTSQTCSRCGKVGSRYSSSFVCLHCGFASDSDFNASCNLRRHLITMPYNSMDEGKGSFGTSASDIRVKYPAFRQWEYVINPTT